MEGKIIKQTAGIGFVEYDIDKRISFTVMGVHDFNIDYERIIGSPIPNVNTDTSATSGTQKKEKSADAVSSAEYSSKVL